MSGPSLVTMAMRSCRGVISNKSQVVNGPAATTAEKPGDDRGEGEGILVIVQRGYQLPPMVSCDLLGRGGNTP